MAFYTNWLFENLLRDTPTRSSRFQGQDHFPAIVSMVDVAEKRSAKMALSYDLFIIIIIVVFLQTSFLSTGSMKNIVNIPKNSTIASLCALVITFSY